MVEITVRLKERTRFGLLLLLTAPVVLLWACPWLVLDPRSNQNATIFGNMFEALNALFSGLAFVGLIFTILLQRDELVLQRQELADTRAELAGQREQLERQNDTLVVQRFENTFFQLIRVHNDIVEEIDRPAFSQFYEQLRQEMGPDAAELTTEELSSRYLRFYGKYQQYLGHYFRHLYHIFKFVKSADIANRRQYTALIRAQLSNYELAILFYNCLAQHGREKFKPLIEEFAVFDNLPSDLLLGHRHEDLYAPEAFGATSASGG
jgi:hypothetical protein